MHFILILGCFVEVVKGESGNISQEGPLAVFLT